MSKTDATAAATARRLADWQKAARATYVRREPSGVRRTLAEYVTARCSMAVALDRMIRAGAFKANVPTVETLHGIFTLATGMKHKVGGRLKKAQVYRGEYAERARISKTDGFAAAERLAEFWAWWQEQEAASSAAAAKDGA